MPHPAPVLQDELAEWLYQRLLSALKSTDGEPRARETFTETLRGVCNRISEEMGREFKVGRG